MLRKIYEIAGKFCVAFVVVMSEVYALQVVYDAIGHMTDIQEFLVVYCFLVIVSMTMHVIYRKDINHLEFVIKLKMAEFRAKNRVAKKEEASAK